MLLEIVMYIIPPALLILMYFLWDICLNVRRYEFKHNLNENSIFINARSENEAWEKMTKKMIAMIYGRYALTYDKDKVKKELKHVTLITGCTQSPSLVEK